MLLFRSEEHVRRWSEDRGSPIGVTLTPAQGWRLASAWYADRLSAGWRRRTPTEAQALLDGIGLTGRFWQLTEVSSDAPADTPGA